MRGLFVLYWGVEMDYMTITEASKKWNISNRRIQTEYVGRILHPAAAVFYSCGGEI
jgi:hypothetical protein